MSTPTTLSVASLLASTARTATANSTAQINQRWTGVHVVVNVSATTGATITPRIQVRSPQSTAIWYDLLIGAAITSTGTTVLKVAPGLVASANAAAADVLPGVWRARVVAASTKSVTYSVGAHLTGGGS